MWIARWNRRQRWRLLQLASCSLQVSWLFSVRARRAHSKTEPHLLVCVQPKPGLGRIPQQPPPLEGRPFRANKSLHQHAVVVKSTGFDICSYRARALCRASWITFRAERPFARGGVAQFPAGTNTTH